MKAKENIRFSKIYKQWYVLLIFSAFLATALLLIGQLSLVRETELKLVDYRFRLDPHPEGADTNVVIVAIDDGSLDFFKNNGISWPWPRSFYGYAVDYFTAAGAKAVLFDMQFYEPDIDREETESEETDGAFAEAMLDNGSIYLGVQLSEDSLAAQTNLSNFTLPVKSMLKKEVQLYHGLIAPISVFLHSCRGIGIINVVPDPDGVIRRVPLIHRMQSYSLPQMSFSAWYNCSHIGETITSRKNSVETGDVNIPMDREGNFFVNWYGNRAGVSPFRYYPFQAVIASASAYFYGGMPQIPPSALRDKYIIIGATAAGLLDLKTNPFTKILPGMEIWATTLSNLLNHDFIRFTPSWIDFLIALIIIFLVFYFVTHFSAKNGNLLLFLLLVAILGINYLFWMKSRILLNLIITLLAFMLSYLLIVTISYLLEGKSKREIRRIFTRYLHPDVIRKLEDNPDQVQLGGEEIKATVLYTDIYNFTTISESKTPKKLVEELNEYFQKLTGLVLEHGGLLDKYTGDGIMALFGAPIARDDHALMACRAAIAHKHLRESLRQKQNRTSPEELHINTRTGINSGPLVAGNIGSDKRMDYTAIGDTVNLAARLEGVNKIYKTKTIISENTFTLVKDHFICRELDFLRVKGKTQPTRIYELIDDIDAEVDHNELEIYQKALQLYRDGNFQEAADTFKLLEDSAAKVMLDRCQYLIKNPPEQWDGILTLEVK